MIDKLWRTNTRCGLATHVCVCVCVSAKKNDIDIMDNIWRKMFKRVLKAQKLNVSSRGNPHIFEFNILTCACGSISLCMHISLSPIYELCL